MYIIERYYFELEQLSDLLIVHICGLIEAQNTPNNYKSNKKKTKTNETYQK